MNDDPIAGDTGTGGDNNTFKLAYSINWQTIAIGTFVDNELVDEEVITSSQNPDILASGDLKPSWSKSGDYIVFMRTISGSAIMLPIFWRESSEAYAS